MEGQAGTVGFVKRIVKVQLKDDPAGTLLSWDADAQVGTRLAQLDGPIMDATSKQLPARYFLEFANVTAPTRKTPPDPTPAVGAAPGTCLSAPGAGASPIASLRAW